MTTYTLNQLQLDGLILNCGSAVGRDMLQSLQPNTQEPVDFDVWQENPYTKVLMKSIKDDYVPKHNTQEPSAWMQTDCIGERSLMFDEPYQPSPLKDKVDPLFTHQAPQTKPLTDAFAKAASEHGLTLVITVDGYKLMKCGPATAHGVKP